MKKIISLLLAVSMLFGMLNLAFAAEEEKAAELKVYFYEDFVSGYEENELKITSLSGPNMKREMHNGEWVYHPTVPGGYETVSFSKSIKVPGEEAQQRPKLVLEYKVSGMLYGGSNIVGYNNTTGVSTVFLANTVREDAYNGKVIANADLAAGITATIVYDNEKPERDIYIDGKYVGTYSTEASTYGRTYVDSGELKLAFFNQIQSLTEVYYHYFKVYEAPADYSPETFVPALYKNLGKPSGLMTAVTVNNDNFYFDMVDSLGFFDKVEYGAYEAEKPMTRLQFASILSKMLNAYPSDEVKGYYYDIALRHFMVGKLEALYDMGVMKGISATEFGAKTEMALTHAVTAYMRALGYTDVAEYNGGYPAGYMAVANKIGLLKGIDTGAQFTQEAAMRLTYNFLNSEIYEIVGISDKRVTRDTASGNTILKVYHNIESVVGIMNANRSTALDSAEGMGDGTVRIEDKVLSCKDSGTGVYLGYNVEAYYEDEFKELLYINVTTKNKTAKISAAEFRRYQDNKIYYEKGDKEQSYNLSVSMDVVYNGKVTPFNKVLFDTFRLGTITLIDNNKDSAYDVAIIDSYVNRVVDSKSVASEIIKFKNDRGTIAFGSYEDYEIRDAQGKSKNLEDIKNDSVLSILESADKKYALIYIGENSVIGNLEQKTSEGKYDIFTIDGVNYSADPDFVADYPAVNVGSTAEFFTDVYGIIAGYSEFAGKGEGYAYIITMKEKGKMDDSILVKLYTEFGQLGAFETKDKITVDGNRVSSKALIGATPFYKTANVTVDGITEQVTSFVPQLIKYKLDDKGKLDFIDTSFYNEGVENGENSLQPVTAGNLRYDNIDKAFGNDIYLNNGCMIFIVPGNPVEADEDDFSCSTSGLRNESFYNVTAYNTSVENFGVDALFAVVDKSSSFDSYSYAYVISDISKVYDAKEEKNVTKLSYFYQKNEKSIYVDDEEMIKDIEVGDVCVIDVEDGYLYGIKQLCDADDPYRIVAPARGQYWRGAYGYIQSLKGNLFKFVQEIPTKDADGNVTAVNDGGAELHRIPAYIYLVDTKRGKVTLGANSDIIDRSADEVNYSKVVFYETHGYDYGLVIYK